MKQGYIEMRDSYDMWSRNIKKPSELKEAALYALEQRMINEENNRLNENVMIKDTLSKLIYSLQQHLWGTSNYLRNKK